MKKLYPLLPVLFLIYSGCEKELEEDTTPPTVSITSLVSGQFVSEIVTISVTTKDDDGISKVEFFVGDSLHLTDTETPYEYDWITTTYEDGSEHIIRVKSYDNSDNSTESSPLSCTVDNSTSVPQGGNITSVTYTTTEMMVEWEESTDGDFNDYKVLFSDTENGNKDTLETFTDISTTSYTITEFDPLIENWFWVKVTDTLGLSRIGTGMSNSIDLEPYPVNVTSVNYDLETMDITWEEYVPNVNRINQMNINTRSSVTNDFQSYELLHSESEEGIYTSIIVITDQSITSYSLIEFDPTQENWFKIKVTDYWGLYSIGTGLSNDIEETPPISSELFPIVYENSSIVIKWSKNYDDDFMSYSVYESDSEDMTNEIMIFESNDRIDTTYIKTILNLRYYQIVIEDYWGLKSRSNIEHGDYNVELWGESYSVFNTTELNLNSHGLTGEIPSEIGNLSNLERLYLYNNELTGEIPSGIGNLTNLKILSIYNNGLTGEIPSEIGNLSNLEKLYLYNNELTGEIPSEIGYLNNLEHFHIWNNELIGGIPREIGYLTNLTELYLYLNELIGEIPSEIGNMTNLMGFSFSSNNLIGSIPPEIGNLNNLEILSIGNNELTGEIPSEIWSLPNLWRLDLNDNQLTGSLPPEIGNSTNMSWLYLRNNQLTGEIPSEIGNLINLERFYLNDNQFSGLLPETICDLNWDSFLISYFSITNNQLCPPYPSCIVEYIGDQDITNCE